MLTCRHESEKSTAPMPWIRTYVTAASLVCFLAILADVIFAFQSKKFWFPYKLFTINAGILTLLDVTTKMSLDLSADMYETLVARS